MFSSALTKLTLIYVLIVMIISISFSVVLYNISSDEIGRGLGRQNRVLHDINTGEFFIEDLERLRLEQINESNEILKLKLIYFNLIILASASVASYFLAKVTLRPIKESMDAQSRFTADASHELRTPLTAMKTEIEVNLRDKSLKIEEAKNLLKSNIEEINKLEYLSGALLKLAKMDDENKREFTDVNLAHAAQMAIDKVDKIADKKSITISAKLKNYKVRGDETSLTELLIILLDNAIKYSPNNSQINLSMLKNKSHIEISVSDHGIGIKATDIPHLFERFYRADLSRSKENVEGYGLGLSIAKRIANIHSAEILVSSKLGKGSTFTVKF